MGVGDARPVLSIRFRWPDTSKRPCCSELIHGATSSIIHYCFRPTHPKMKTACGGCHAFPHPAAFTHRTWDHALPYVYRVLDEFHGGDPAGVSLEAALAYYRRHAAIRLPPPPMYPAHKPLQYPEPLGPDVTRHEGAAIIVDLVSNPGQLRGAGHAERDGSVIVGGGFMGRKRPSVTIPCVLKVRASRVPDRAFPDGRPGDLSGGRH